MPSAETHVASQNEDVARAILSKLPFEMYEQRWKIGKRTLTQRRPRSEQRLKPRWVMQHIWKCGGTNLCALARHNGRKVPPSVGCSIMVDPDKGWPAEDYDIFGNERPIPRGTLRRVYGDRNRLANSSGASDGPDSEARIFAEDVRHVTILRHPYARSLSHYYHKKETIPDLTMEQFFVPCGGCGGGGGDGDGGTFDKYIPDQQTRWHCGTDECVKADALLSKDFEVAASNLRNFDAVLILEDMDTPFSCTRLQLRHLLNFAVETFPSNHTGYRGSRNTKDWVSAWKKDVGPDLAKSLAYHNAMDMQLYGMARELCERKADLIRHGLEEGGERAAKIDSVGVGAAKSMSPDCQYVGSALSLAFILGVFAGYCLRREQGKCVVATTKSYQQKQA